MMGTSKTEVNVTLTAVKVVHGQGGHHRYRRQQQNGRDECTARSKTVVHLHMRPVCAEIAKISASLREPTKNGAIGLGHQPAENNVGDRYEGSV